MKMVGPLKSLRAGFFKYLVPTLKSHLVNGQGWWQVSEFIILHKLNR